jgi:hypothetical protein
VDVDGVLESLEGVVEGVVDGVVDGVDSSPPMFGQSPCAWSARLESSATTAAGLVAEPAAEADEPVAAWATAPPASTAVAASVTTILRERRNMCVHLLSWCQRSEPAPCKSNL